MTGETREPILAETPAEAEPPAPSKVSGPPAKGVIRGDKGIETAQVLISAFLIVVVGVLTYLPLLDIPFQGEDQALLVTNAALHRIVTFTEALGEMPCAPLTLFGYAVNWWLCPQSAAGFHAVNLLFHLANGVLLYLLCRRLLGSGTPEPISMLAGMLLVAHPLATENVNYVVGRPELQAAFFSLLALLLFRRAMDEGKTVPSRSGTRSLGTVPVFLALCCYVLAFASEATALGLPLLMLGMDFTLRGRRKEGVRIVRHGQCGACQGNTANGGKTGTVPSKRVPERDGTVPAFPLGTVPVFTVHACFFGLLVLLCVARNASGIADTAALAQGIGQRPALQAQLLMNFAAAVFVPVQVNPIYPAASGIALNGLGAAALALLGLAALFGLVRRSPVGLALLWCLVAIAMVPCLVPLRTVLADRHLYFALAGCTLLPSWLISRFQVAWGRVLMGALAGVLVLASCYLAYQRTALWTDPVRLWTQVGAQFPASPTPWRYLGRYLGERAAAAGTAEEQQALWVQSDQAWRTALDLSGPQDGEALCRLGVSLYRLGRTEEALPYLKNALRMDPFDQQASAHIALIQYERFRARGDKDALRLAIDYFGRAEKLGALSPETLAHYGTALAALGDFEKAVPMLERVVGEDAESPLKPVLNQLKAMVVHVRKLESKAQQEMMDTPAGMAGFFAQGELRMMRGQLVEAAYLFDLVLRNEPDNTRAWPLLGYVRACTEGAESFVREWGAARLWDSGAWQELVMRCCHAQLLEPALCYAEYAGKTGESAVLPHVRVADIAARLGQVVQARRLLEKGTEAHPDDPQPWLRLADIASLMKEPDEARRCLMEAERRHPFPEDLEARSGKARPEAAEDFAPVRTIIR